MRAGCAAHKEILDVETAAPGIKRVTAKALVFGADALTAHGCEEGFTTQGDPSTFDPGRNNAALPMRHHLRWHLFVAAKDGECRDRPTAGSEITARKGIGERERDAEIDPSWVAALDDRPMADGRRVPDQILRLLGNGPCRRGPGRSSAGEAPDLIAFREEIQEVRPPFGGRGFSKIIGHAGVSIRLAANSDRLPKCLISIRSVSSRTFVSR